MRYSASEKRKMIKLVEQSSLPVGQTLRRLDINKSTFYNWLQRYRCAGDEALTDKHPGPNRPWNQPPESRQIAVVDLALSEPELSPRELAVKYTDETAYFVSESTVYRLLKAQELITSPAYILMQASAKFQQPTTRVNQMWQTDFTYLKVIGWGWYYLSTVLDDYSGFIVAWRLCSSMSARDVSDTLDEALEFTGMDQVHIKHKPRLLSDNGPSYVAAELKTYLDDQGMTHTRGRPYHPMTQGKIERWHRSMKNQVLLEHYYLPGDLERRISQFVNYYNHERYHESLDNLTPADVFYRRGQQILNKRENIKLKTLALRKQMHYRKQLQHNPMS